MHLLYIFFTNCVLCCAVFNKSKKLDRSHISSYRLLNNFSLTMNSSKQAIHASFHYIFEIIPFTPKE